MKLFFSSSLYVSDGLKSKKKRICHQMLRGKGFFHLYAIILNENTRKPEILPTIFLRQSYFKTCPLRIIGLTETKEQALNYVAELISDNYMRNGTISMEEKVKEC